MQTWNQLYRLKSKKKLIISVLCFWCWSPPTTAPPFEGVRLHQEVLSLSLSANSHESRGFEGLSRSHLFFFLSVCLSGVSTYLFTATCCARRDAHTRAPDWHFRGGMGVKHQLISRRLWRCTQLGLPYSITNTVSRLLTEKYLDCN